MEAAEAAVVAAQARLANARERQAFQTFRAPFAGVIAARNIERGDRRGSGDPMIARVDAGNTLEHRQVTLGRNLGNDVEVLSGIAAGDAVVLAPNAMLVEGDRVRLRNPAEAAD